MPLKWYDADRHRKHLTAGQREAFLKAIEDTSREGMQKRQDRGKGIFL